METSKREPAAAGGPAPVPIWAVVVAAGASRRMGALGPKVWWRIAGRPMWVWALEAFEAGPVQAGVLVVAAEQVEAARRLLAEQRLRVAWEVTAGGAERLDSVERGVRQLPPGPADGVVLVHDAARPLVSPALVARVTDAAVREGGAVPGLTPVDTVKTVAEVGQRVIATLDRRRIRLAQTPQGFRRGILEAALQAFRRAGSPPPLPTDEADLVQRYGYPVVWVEGEARARKVTVPEDREWLERWAGPVDTAAALGGPAWRVGQGVDIHPLVAGRPLVLGGVTIPFERGLDGDSDADVLVHALIDALLGAMGEGDLGRWFPPEAARGRSSLELLQAAWQKVRAHGYVLGNADATVVAQRPRLSPYVATMREQLAARLDSTPDRLSIKATTPDHLGWLGREEGIAAQAVVLLVAERP